MCVCVVKINQRKYDHYSQDQKKTETKYQLHNKHKLWNYCVKAQEKQTH